MDYKLRVVRYYHLSKPGIIYGNQLTLISGYLFAAKYSISLPVIAGLIVGYALVIAGACAANNYLDRGIDAKMQRTKERSLVSGDMMPQHAVMFSAIATLTGLAILGLTQNAVTITIAAVAWFAYVVMYGYSKRVTVHGTLIGCISGSAPLVAGYTAASGTLDTTALMLFVLMTCWQMAHFYGIALRRQKDYAAAGIPVMPVVHGAVTTQRQIFGYIGLYIGIVVLMAVTGRLGIATATIIAIVAVIWLYRSLTSLARLNYEAWGRAVFLFSLTVILVQSVMLSLDPLLP